MIHLTLAALCAALCLSLAALRRARRPPPPLPPLSVVVDDETFYALRRAPSGTVLVTAACAADEHREAVLQLPVPEAIRVSAELAEGRGLARELPRPAVDVLRVALAEALTGSTVGIVLTEGFLVELDDGSGPTYSVQCTWCRARFGSASSRGTLRHMAERAGWETDPADGPTCRACCKALPHHLARVSP